MKFHTSATKPPTRQTFCAFVLTSLSLYIYICVSIYVYLHMCICVCVCACVRAVRACVSACVRVCCAWVLRDVACQFGVALWYSVCMCPWTCPPRVGLPCARSGTPAAASANQI